MFTKTNSEPTHLETVIDSLLTRLENTDASSEEFAHITDQLVKLNAMLPKKEPFVKAETLIPVVGNLAGIFAILNFERAGVITSKALNFVVKSRV